MSGIICSSCMCEIQESAIHAVPCNSSSVRGPKPADAKSPVGKVLPGLCRKIRLQSDYLHFRLLRRFLLCRFRIKTAATASSNGN